MGELISKELSNHLYRFISKIGSTDGCWLWKGSKTSDDRANIFYEGKNISAARLSYMFFLGSIEGGLHVLHQCDNPLCVNPKHLFLGTPQDNAIDRELKGRGRKLSGEDNGNTKMTKAKVIEMRSLYPSMSYSELAKKYGILYNHVYRIIKRKAWENV